jgi:hypothetical protein
LRPARTPAAIYGGERAPRQSYLAAGAEFVAGAPGLGV